VIVNALEQRDFLNVVGTSPGVEHSFGYDSYGRLASVGAGDESAEYVLVVFCLPWEELVAPKCRHTRR
jgi:hypothetical protein